MEFYSIQLKDGLMTSLFLINSLFLGIDRDVFFFSNIIVLLYNNYDDSKSFNVIKRGEIIEQGESSIHYWCDTIMPIWNDIKIRLCDYYDTI